jgi:predicted nuclease of restriction endonuclease-like RecB superfamily
MIPSDLLRYRIDYKINKIYPLLCSIDNNSSEYQLAKRIIEIFDECYSNKNSKDILRYKIKLLEYSEKDYKLIRGLYSILEKKCGFKPIFENEKNINLQSSDTLKKIITKLNPIDIRRMVFQESALNNIAVTDNKRYEILNRVSCKLNTDIETIRILMWSDLEENTTIYNYYSLDPKLLLLYYNISLIQTLLFNCLRIEIKINSKKSVGLLWKGILKEIKKLGLMYWLETDINNTNNNNKNDLICTVEGPLTIIKLTEKYGNSIAKLIPSIFKAPNWSIKADILRISSSGNKTIYNFEISEQSHSDKISTKILEKMQEDQNKQQIMNNEKAFKEKKDLSYENEVINKDELFFNSELDNNYNNIVSYDSNIEKIFAEKFELFNTGWLIEREPEPLITKFKTAFIPDFNLSKYQNKVLVEIIGFWTKEYLERKIQKIIQIIENYDSDNFYMILIINFENLAMYETEQVYSFSSIKNKSNMLIVPYKNEYISFQKIIPFLKKIERKYIEQHFENDIDKNKLIQEINVIFKDFRNSPNLKITLEDINKIIILKQKMLESSFNLKKVMENNNELNNLVIEKIVENELIKIKDVIFKKAFIKEIYKGLNEKKIDNLKDACNFLLVKKISEKIHIDLLISIGFEIDWNGLDYSESKIKFRQ